MKGKKVKILEGINAGAIGEVIYEDNEAVAIASPDGYWGLLYERKDNVKEI